ncbi:hypothetical protein CANCADRAFT_505 [Tortispora caseinolytica NRRL Y-17796]|uniref:NmrA-like domain-containing protein n=1 Tax=Tortispora caseinolytica NRRL Y-17796 TaxID=767744 RepID=A0A1E4TJS4_9ASCO|nr:hypothetical protein CANCADRAFT_505 [Tortispora caseinolytica NRRL Y-17796]
MSYKIAIAGSKGFLAKPIIAAATRIFADRVNSVVVLTRDESKEEGNISYTQVDYSKPDAIVSALKGVDALINTIGVGQENSAHRTLTDAAVKANVKVYVPSEFGTNYINADFTFHHVFSEKKKLFEYAQSRIRTVAIVSSMFAEFLAPVPKLVGINDETMTAQIYGKDYPLSVSALADIGNSTVSAVILALDGKDVPSHVKIASSTFTVGEFLSRYESVTGKKFDVQILDAKKDRETLEPTMDFMEYIRILMGTGASLNVPNHNELVNPGESLWKWTDYFEELCIPKWK